jgi:hypothetical protein
VPSYREWILPALDYHGMWECLYFDSSIKRRLLKYAASALVFADHRVNSQLISWNRWVGGRRAGAWALLGCVWGGLARGWGCSSSSSSSSSSLAASC